MNYTVVISHPHRATVISVADSLDTPALPDRPLLLIELAKLAGLTQPHVSQLVRDGMVYAPLAEKGRRRAIPVPEVRRVLLVARLARQLDIPPTVLFRALHDGQAALLPDGRIALGPVGSTGNRTDVEGSQLVA